ncbi:hypothetical protein HXP45_17805 [Streptomyces actuosus]|uniref:Secreted protein n=1 Tax=Streptomyces griseosporeus TaxID=1910 RepID=A0ABV3KFW7_STRGS|nr:hypothetical protein [Streptomyces actuosus]
MHAIRRAVLSPAVALLTAVLLAWPAVLGFGASPLAAPDVSATVGAQTQADEKWDTAASPARPVARHEAHTDPAPRAHPAFGDPGPLPVPPRSWRLPAPAGKALCPAPHTPPDRGRAPPATSGT